MRKAFSDFELVEHEDKIIGIALGYDFCAEHEWGIEGIIKRLGIKGISKKTFGFKSRINNKVPKSLIFGKDKDRAALIMHAYDYDEKYTKFDWKNLPYDFNKNQRALLTKNEENTLQTAWSENDFGILVEGEKSIKFLETLFKAFQNKNVLVGTFKKMRAFCNPSLTFLIKDLIPESIEKEMIEIDKKSFELTTIINKFNLEKKLKDADKWWEDKYDNIMCASISWNNNEKFITKHPVIVWINAHKNFGWYTIEEVEAFIKDKTGKQLVEFKTQRNEK